jgi:hypothetical protein
VCVRVYVSFSPFPPSPQVSLSSSSFVLVCTYVVE